MAGHNCLYYIDLLLIVIVVLYFNLVFEIVGKQSNVVFSLKQTKGWIQNKKEKYMYGIMYCITDIYTPYRMYYFLYFFLLCID